jgi:anti-sigma-K factor RskA
MSSSSHHIPEEVQVLAGEYVLGVLDTAEMRAVRRRAAADPLLIEAITAWEQRLEPLAAAVAPQTPPVALWTRIETAIAPLQHDLTEPAPLHVPPERLAPPARPGRPQPVARPRRIWPWQAATGAALALAAALAAFALLPRPQPPIAIAALAPPNAAAGFMAQAEPDGSVELTPLSPSPVPPGHDMELWILPKGAHKPTSLGVLPATGRHVKLPAPPAPGTQLMISLEPQGGSPTGSPTGPVVYAGSFGPPSL